MEHFYCVIMSGGVGSRFWPLSRQDKPKQFLDFFGTGRTLLQQTFERFSQVVPKEHIYIVTHADYIALTLEQLPEISRQQILVEPTRRNTAPCIAYASYHIHQLDPRATIVVAASDHVILHTELFVQTIQNALHFASTHPYLMTLGIQPTTPETGYGYIQISPREEPIEGRYHRVKLFTEKPNLDMAKIFVACGEFLWNSGMFVWQVDVILDAFRKYLPEVATLFEEQIHGPGTPTERAVADEIYPYCPNISIDYGVLEAADNVLVTRANFGWADLGSWGSLHNLSDKTAEDNVVQHGKTLLYDSRNNIIHIDDPTLVAVIQGLDGYIIAKQGQALLICKREAEQHIKSYVADVEIHNGPDYV